MIAETALTSMLPRVRAQMVTSGATPPEANARSPEMIASFITLPPANFAQPTLTSMPAAFACFSISFCSSISISGK